MIDLDRLLALARREAQYTDGIVGWAAFSPRIDHMAGNLREHKRSTWELSQYVRGVRHSGHRAADYAIRPREYAKRWAAGNRLRLISPDSSKAFEPSSYAVNSLRRKVSGTYYFKEDPVKGPVNPAARGWSLVYEAPSTPVEFTVPFAVKDVPLP